MPEYIYRAMTDKGQVVRNRVEDVSKQILIQKLKKSNLLPISIVQVGYTGSRKKATQQKRNITFLPIAQAYQLNHLDISLYKHKN